MTNVITFPNRPCRPEAAKLANLKNSPASHPALLLLALSVPLFLIINNGIRTSGLQREPRY